MAALTQIAGWSRGGMLSDTEKIGWFDRLALWINGYRFDIGTFSRDVSTASGTQEITGVPFRPSAIQFMQGGGTLWMFGFDTVDDKYCVYSAHSVTADTVGTSSTSSLVIQGTAGNQYLGNVLTFNENGFTINWTKVGSPTGTSTFAYMAFK